MNIRASSSTSHEYANEEWSESQPLTVIDTVLYARTKRKLNIYIYLQTVLCLIFKHEMSPYTMQQNKEIERMK